MIEESKQSWKKKKIVVKAERREDEEGKEKSLIGG
jgi:hypothetical protein